MRDRTCALSSNESVPAAFTLAADPGDSDPDPDEALRRVRGATGTCPFCHGPNTIGHTCASLSPTGMAALDRALVVIEQDRRDREQTIRDQVDAAYAEHADLPRAEYRAWVIGEAA